LDISLVRAVQEIKQGRVAGFYLLYGCNDLFSIKWMETELHRRSRQEDLAVVVRYYPVDQLAQALGEAYTGSLFGPSPIVSIREAECLTTTFKGKMAQDEILALQWLIDEPPAQPVVISCKGEKLDERKKVIKALLASPHARMIAAGKHTSEERRVILREQLSGQSFLTKSQEDYVLLQSGSSLDRLTSEAQKLLLYAGERRAITDEELHVLVAHDADSDVFAMIRLVVTGNSGAAYRMYQETQASESAFGLMALLARQYRLLAQVQDKMIAALPDTRVATLCGVHPYAVKVAREQAKSLSYAQCVLSLVELADLEYAIKSGQLNEQTAMDLFFLRRMQNA